MTSIVRSTIAALTDAGLPAEWHPTGGGCFAIRVQHDTLDISIADREDIYDINDLDSDEALSGFWATATDKEGEPVGPIDETGTFFFTPSHETGNAAAVATDIPELVAAVVAIAKEA